MIFITIMYHHENPFLTSFTPTPPSGLRTADVPYEWSESAEGGWVSTSELTSAHFTEVLNSAAGQWALLNSAVIGTV